MDQALQDSLRAFFYRPDGTRRSKAERLALVNAGIAAAVAQKAESKPTANRLYRRVAKASYD